MVDGDPVPFVLITSVLTSIKKLLGIEETYTNFDQDIIMHINSVLMIVNQLGLGSATGLFIEDNTTTWDDLFAYQGLAHNDLYALKTYIYLKVRLVFDPPQMGYLVEAITNQCIELEWRLNVQAEGVVV